MDDSWQEIRSQLRQSRYTSADKTQDLIEKSLILALSQQNDRIYATQNAYSSYVYEMEAQQVQTTQSSVYLADSLSCVYRQLADHDSYLSAVFSKLKHFCRVYGIKTDYSSILAMLDALFAFVRRSEQFDSRIDSKDVFEVQKHERQLYRESASNAALEAQVIYANSQRKQLALENQKLRYQLQEGQQPALFEIQQLHMANYELQQRVIDLETALLHQSRNSTLGSLPQVQESRQKTKPATGQQCVKMLRLVGDTNDKLKDLVSLIESNRQPELGDTITGSMLTAGGDYEQEIAQSLQTLREFVIDGKDALGRLARQKQTQSCEMLYKSCIDEWKSQLSASQHTEAPGERKAMFLLLDEQYNRDMLLFKEKLFEIEGQLCNFKDFAAILSRIEDERQQCEQAHAKLGEKVAKLSDYLHAAQQRSAELEGQLIAESRKSYLEAFKSHVDPSVLEEIISKLMGLLKICGVKAEEQNSSDTALRANALLDYLGNGIDALILQRNALESKKQALEQQVSSAEAKSLQADARAADRDYLAVYWAKELDDFCETVSQKTGALQNLLDEQDYEQCATLFQLADQATHDYLENAAESASSSADDSTKLSHNECSELVAFLDTISGLVRNIGEAGIHKTDNLLEAANQVIECDSAVFSYVIEQCGDAMRYNGCFEAVTRYLEGRKLLTAE